MGWLGKIHPAFSPMPVRGAVLLIPSLSSRPIHSPSSRQIAHESPQFPVFVFKGLRTLPSSVSRKSCVCRSYENCRVTSFKLKVFLPPRRALSSLFPSLHQEHFTTPLYSKRSALFQKTARVCTDNSQCGAYLRRDNRHPRSFFSCTYELQIFELLCFDIHTNWWGVYPGCTPGCTPLQLCYHPASHPRRRHE